jgi:hypothetical protein
MLLHDGQIEGRRVRVPVFLARRLVESPDEGCREFYRRLLSSLQNPALQEGEWRLADALGWPDNDSCRNLVGWMWRKNTSRVAVVVNLSLSRSQGRVPLGWLVPGDGPWVVRDPIAGERYERSGHELWDPGLFVDLAPWGVHFLELSPGQGS